MARAPVAVIDVETTGVNPHKHDRVIEVGIVVCDEAAKTLREFCTLVNPNRDVGPSRLHGLEAQDLVGAPGFEDVAGHLVATLDGVGCVAGHNVRFDLEFLASEFSRMGVELPPLNTACTLAMSGGGALGDACETFGVAKPKIAHSALHDARATAALLAAILRDAPTDGDGVFVPSPIAWPAVPRATAAPVTRIQARTRPKAHETFMQRLLARAGREFVEGEEEPAFAQYVDLIDRVLEDRVLTEVEMADVQGLAERLGLKGGDIDRIHRGYLVCLARAAFADGTLTAPEEADLRRVASLLGLGEKGLREARAIASRPRPAIEPPAVSLPQQPSTFLGKTVCFTGESHCEYDGAPLTRSKATRLAEAFGLNVVDAVTKRLDMLVTADPDSMSGKAKKARQYGIRVLPEVTFWRALGVEVE